MIERRSILIAAGVSAFAPLAAFAQQGKVWRVGFLVARGRPTSSAPDPHYDAFTIGMRDLGYVQHKNVVIELRSADGNYERLPELAAELVRLKVDVIVAASTRSTAAAQKATSTIPIVIAGSADPVAAGFAKTLSHPGGNITGTANLVGDTSAKHLEMLRSIMPRLSRVAVLRNPENSSHSGVVKNIEAAGRASGLTVLPFDGRSPEEIENAFFNMTQKKAGALIVLRYALLIRQQKRITELSASNRLPTMYANKEAVEAGGLMSYGSDLTEAYRRAAYFVDRILKGAKPGDLPIEQPTKFEMVINMKAAKALGLKIPQSILVQATQVIE